MRHAAILAGGGGTRLWPASRKSKPKQFLPFGAREGESLLAGTIRRLEPVVGGERMWIVTARDQADLAARETRAQVLAEPAARNTAAAIGWVASRILELDPDAVIAAIPADHAVRDDAAFAKTMDRAFSLAEERDAIVTVGIVPTRAETGFGWLALGADGQTVTRFVEKPPREAAERMLAAGGHLWNAGIFVFRARRILDELARHLPAHADALRRGDDAAYAQLPSISIDHGVMEKTTGILTVPGDFGWNDVGAWSALAETAAADANGNVTRATVVAHDARGNIVFADAGTVVALVGVEDLVVVQSGNAVLVLPRSRAQDVREVVRELEARGLGAYL